MKLSDMKQVLAAEEIQLTKSLGQNFLHDANQLRRIVELAELGHGDKVLEIGPGLGPLTQLLLERASEVLAIEKDQRLVEVLKERLRIGKTESHSGVADDCQKATLHLVHGDALEYLRRERRDWRDWKLVANLPYSVASPILVELALDGTGPERMVTTLQLEVVRRLSAKANDQDYGVLSLLVQLDYEPREWFKIPASCFFPKPDVDSACICLVRRPGPLLAPEQRTVFTRLVKRSFSQRRKMMLKLLRADWSQPMLERAFAEIAVPRDARAETLSLQHFVRLTQALGTKV